MEDIVTQVLCFKKKQVPTTGIQMVDQDLIVLSFDQQMESQKKLSLQKAMSLKSGVVVVIFLLKMFFK